MVALTYHSRVSTVPEPCMVLMASSLALGSTALLICTVPASAALESMASTALASTAPAKSTALLVCTVLASTALESVVLASMAPAKAFFMVQEPTSVWPMCLLWLLEEVYMATLVLCPAATAAEWNWATP
mmetsp:Transcript_87421/g.199733  ORF Transcript_87421/g.199733 Transcript_87421/m.199733 type:complete len:130 (+) Transcript_87421:676-1065(+)